MTDEIVEAVNESLKGFGGYLRCETCGHRVALDDDMDVRDYLRHGWPRHCGYTMRWWTQRQVLAGEVTSAGGWVSEDGLWEFTPEEMLRWYPEVVGTQP